jgi:energy-coupling factor transporter ATPase
LINFRPSTVYIRHGWAHVNHYLPKCQGKRKQSRSTRTWLKPGSGPHRHIRLTKVRAGSIFVHVIELDSVSYRYSLAESSPPSGDQVRSILALDGINLELREGQSVAILGSNGSGKTTLIKLLNALLLPAAGRVMVDGLDTKEKGTHGSVRQKVGMVFQNPDNQIISTSVEREIAFGLENLALPYEEMKTRVQRALKYFNLDQYRNHPPHKLSGGEKQKVALAAVLSMRPKYLVLDEPTSLLDPLGGDEVISLIRMLCDEQNVTVIHVTQFPEEAAMAERVLVMDQGRIALDGSPLEVFNQEDRLNDIGLGIPFPIRISSALRRRGWKGLGESLTMDALVDDIVRNIKEGRQGSKVLAADRGPRTAGNSDGGPSTVDGGRQSQILLHQVTYLYDQSLPTQRKALDSVSLEIKKGEFIGLIGPTGSGKSTLAQHLNGLLLPYSGEVSVDGENTKEKGIDLKKIRQKVGLVFQFPELQLFEETVYEDIAFGPKNLGLSESDISQRVKEAMRSVGLEFEQFAFRSPFHLSGGEQRKVAIAGILALKPEILVLDEPTCGLDIKSTKEIKSLLQQLNSAGVTIVLISHDMNLIAETAQRVILLDQGKLLAFCEKSELFGDAGRLKSVGLDLPQVTELSRRLETREVKIEKPAFDEEQLVEFLQSGSVR